MQNRKMPNEQTEREREKKNTKYRVRYCIFFSENCLDSDFLVELFENNKYQMHHIILDILSHCIEVDHTN